MQPFEWHFFGEVGQHLDAFEVSTKGFVKLVVMLFVFHHDRAAKVIEVVNAAGIGGGAHHVGLKCFKHIEVLAHRHRQFGGTEGVKEIDQHGSGLARTTELVIQVSFHRRPLGVQNTVDTRIAQRAHGIWVCVDSMVAQNAI